MYCTSAIEAPLAPLEGELDDVEGPAAIVPASGTTTVAAPVAPGARYCRDRPFIETAAPPGFWISTKSRVYAAPAVPPSV